MEIYLIILVIVMVISVLALVYLVSYSHLIDCEKRIIKSSKIIEKSLSEKEELIDFISKDVKKVIKKDYLKDYLNNSELTLEEKDKKLDDAMNVIKDLKRDYKRINNNNKIKDKLELIRELDERIYSSKSLYNFYAGLSNTMIKKIPDKLVAKTLKINNYTLYEINNNKTDDMEIDL